MRADKTRGSSNLTTQANLIAESLLTSQTLPVVDRTELAMDIPLDARLMGREINATIEDDYLYSAVDNCTNVPDSVNDIERYWRESSPYAHYFEVVSVDSLGITGEDSSGHWSYISYSIQYRLPLKRVTKVDFSVSHFISALVNNLAPQRRQTQVWDGHYEQDEIVFDLFNRTALDLQYRPEQQIWLKRYADIKDDAVLAYAVVHAPEIIRTYQSDSAWRSFIEPLEAGQLPEHFEEFRQIWEKSPAQLVKVIVVDADGVLWDGSVGEGGLTAIKISEVRQKFQRILLGLRELGVLLAISSKNDPAALLNEDGGAFVHPDMLLKPSDFAAIMANWESKDRNIVAIARDLNLGLDSFVFVDDSPHERALVRQLLPEVMVFDFPSDLTLLPTTFESLGIGPKILTDEDKQRSQLYTQNQRRRALRSRCATEEDFLRSLEMKVRILRDQENLPYVDRLVSMATRYNQFNLTTIRYNESDFRRIIKDSGVSLFALLYCDREQLQSTLDSFMVVQRNDKQAVIEAFLLSCRALGRTIEDAFLGFVVKTLKDEGIKTILGQYIATERNGMVMELYPKFGFKPIERAAPSDSHLWKMKLGETQLKIPPWFSIVNEYSALR